MGCDDFRAVRGGKASEGRNASRGRSPASSRSARKGRWGRSRSNETPRRAHPKGRARHGMLGGQESGNAVNPRVGSALQYTRPVREEETGEVVRNHEGGTRGGLVALSRRRLSPGNRGWLPGRGLPGEQYDGGAIFGQPQERKRTSRRGGPERGFRRGHLRKEARCVAGPGRVGKDGVKVRRVCQSSRTRTAGTRRWVLEGSDTAQAAIEGHGGQPRRPTSSTISASPYGDVPPSGGRNPVDPRTSYPAGSASFQPRSAAGAETPKGGASAGCSVHL